MAKHKTKRKSEPKPKSGTVYLHYDESRSGGEPEDPADKWIRPLELFIECPDILFVDQVIAHFDPKEFVDKNVFVVIVRYKSGSTFGNSYGNFYLEGVYSSSVEARKVEQSIRQGTYEGYKTWEGYFESLQDVYIQPMILMA